MRLYLAGIKGCGARGWMSRLGPPPAYPYSEGLPPVANNGPDLANAFVQKVVQEIIGGPTFGMPIDTSEQLLGMPPANAIRAEESQFLSARYAQSECGPIWSEGLRGNLFLLAPPLN
ncbi:MAG: hypothetical protein ABIF45_23040 [Pseudomonadota bacterium]